MEFNELLGKTLTEVTGAVGGDEIVFTETGGKRFKLYHDQDCCESVNVEDICGDLADLIDAPIVEAEEISNSEPCFEARAKPSDSFTWTFYKIRTAKGAVTIRWLGESNGYYSESARFCEL